MIHYPYEVWERAYEDGREDAEAGRAPRDMTEPAIVERLEAMGAPQWEDYVAAYRDGYLAGYDAR